MFQAGEHVVPAVGCFSVRKDSVRKNELVFAWPCGCRMDGVWFAKRDGCRAVA